MFPIASVFGSFGRRLWSMTDRISTMTLQVFSSIMLTCHTCEASAVKHAHPI